MLRAGFLFYVNIDFYKIFKVLKEEVKEGDQITGDILKNF